MNRGKTVAFAAALVVVTVAGVRAGVSFAGGKSLAAVGAGAEHTDPLPRSPVTGAPNPRTSTSTVRGSHANASTLHPDTAPAFAVQYELAHVPPGAAPATALPTSLVCLHISANACTRVIGTRGEMVNRGNAQLTVVTTYALEPLTDRTIRATLGSETGATPTAVHDGIGYRVHSDASDNRYDGYLWLADSTTLVSVTSACRPSCASSFSDAEVHAIANTLVAHPLALSDKTPHLISFTTFDDDGTRRPFLFAAAPSADGECVGVVAGQDDDAYGTPDPNAFSCDTIDWQDQHRLFATDDGTFAYGAVRGDVTQVRLEPKDAAPLTLTPGPVEINGGRTFAFPFDISTVDSYNVVALDHAGRVVETWSSADNDFVGAG